MTWEVKILKIACIEDECESHASHFHLRTETGPLSELRFFFCEQLDGGQCQTTGQTSV